MANKVNDIFSYHINRRNTGVPGEKPSFELVLPNGVEVLDAAQLKQIMHDALRMYDEYVLLESERTYQKRMMLGNEDSHTFRMATLGKIAP